MMTKSHIRQFSVPHGFLMLAIWVVTILAAAAEPTAQKALDIYFIDVEGGQATLVVIPGGETLLIDAGFPGDGTYALSTEGPTAARDAQRITAAARDAGVSGIDTLLITHFHPDHFGGAIELSKLIPIRTIVDHGSPAPEALARPASVELFQAYRQVRARKQHMVPSVGDKLPLGDIVATIVSTGGAVLRSPLSGAGANNPACTGEVLAASEKHENPRSTGILIQHGEFRFLDIGDLAGQPLSDLACPANLIGPVDVYLVPHHGAADSADPATLAAFHPRVAILNNGATKGGEAPIFNALRNADGLEDTWQLHRSENEGAENFPDGRIANLDEGSAYWIKLTANRDGSFRVLNGRTGEWKDYAAQ